MTGILNARIVASIAMLVFVGAAIAASTGAFFSDTETSTGNTFTAGDVDITITDLSHLYTGGGVSPDQPTYTKNGFSFALGDLKPLDSGTVTYNLGNGTNDAYLCAAVVETGNNENSRLEPETEAGDVTDGAGNGELGQFLSFKFGTTTGTLNGQWQSLGVIAANGATSTGIGYCFGTYVGGVCQASALPNINRAQTDSITADVLFYAVQTRNNPGFQCSQLPPATGTTTPPTVQVGAALATYAAPSCSVTVTGSNSIQAAVNAASSGQTVCVADSYDRTGDNTAIRIENSGVTLAAVTRGIDLDVPVVLSASGVTVTGFDGVIGQAESPAEQAAFYLDNDASGFSLTFNTVTGGTGAAILTETGAALGGGLIANNVLSGATQGVYTNPHTGVFIIEYNDIDNNVAGIAGLMGATVRYNEFEHTSAAQEAIGVDSTIDSNPATVSFNNFLGDTRVNTYGSIVGDLSAENNFWGPNGGAAQTGGSDEVDFTPQAGAAYAHK
ncbi:hypothetical protein JNK62_03560 [bacterium]|nr:hypothetical protein [bacterium]